MMFRYITSTEWAAFYGGKKPGEIFQIKRIPCHSSPYLDIKEKAGFRRLPFHCCALSLQPFEDPLCANDGTVFDFM